MTKFRVTFEARYGGQSIVFVVAADSKMLATQKAKAELRLARKSELQFRKPVARECRV